MNKQNLVSLLSRVPHFREKSIHRLIPGGVPLSRQMDHVRVEQIGIKDAIAYVVGVAHVQKSNRAAIVEDSKMLVHLVHVHHGLHIVAREDTEEEDFRGGKSTSQL